jgi:small basic protein
MPRVLRNVLALVVGLVMGIVVNMGLVMLGPRLIAPPVGANVTTMEGLRSSIHLFEPKHFLFPFLAHALGTLVGAWLAALLGAGRGLVPALVVGIAFLVGGVANIFMLPSPLWFNVVDLAGAYLPMDWIGARLGARRAHQGGAVSATNPGNRSRS